MSEKMKNIISAVLLIVFTVLVFYGMTTSEFSIVLDKARNICLECIGVG